MVKTGRSGLQPPENPGRRRPPTPGLSARACPREKATKGRVGEHSNGCGKMAASWGVKCMQHK